MKNTKMSSEARRESIMQASRKVFAEKGFRGVTTRQLAEAAGISEGLLFRHFSTKEALYAAIHESCCRAKHLEKWERLKNLETSTKCLVYLVHLLVAEMLKEPSNEDPEEVAFRRMFLRSITEDGELVRTMLQGLALDWVRKTEDCLRAAIAAGDALPGPEPLQVQSWFVHHLSAMVAIHLLPATPIVDYGIGRRKLIEQTVWFTLRGLGVKDEVIRVNYNSHVLASFVL